MVGGCNILNLLYRKAGNAQRAHAQPGMVGTLRFAHPTDIHKTKKRTL
jgi:hypothetical protein